MPTHIQSCPSTVQLDVMRKQIEAQTTEAERKRLGRELMTALRKSELKNNRCLKQALSFYAKVRSQKNKAK